MHSCCSGQGSFPCYICSLIVYCGYSASVTGHIFTVCTLQLQLCSCHRSQVYSLYTTVTAVQLSQVTCLQSTLQLQLSQVTCLQSDCALQLQLYICHRSHVYSYTIVTAVHLSQVTCLPSDCALQLQLCICHRSRVYSMIVHCNGSCTAYTIMAAVHLSQVTCLKTDSCTCAFVRVHITYVYSLYTGDRSGVCTWIRCSYCHMSVWPSGCPVKRPRAMAGCRLFCCCPVMGPGQGAGCFGVVL